VLSGTPLVTLTQPYVSVPEFRAAPTWLDSDDLIPGGVQGQQDEELANVLLRASSWADEHAGGGTDRPWFGAHLVTEQCRTRINRYGQVFLHPSDHPVREITGLAYGADFQSMAVMSDLTQTWVEDSRGIVVSVIPWRGSWTGTLEFGAVAVPGGQMFVQYQYVSGYCNTRLTGAASAGTSTLNVADSTGLQPPATNLLGNLSGSTARIWDAGIEEAVTVAPGFTTGSATVPLTSPLASPHAAGVIVSEFPAAVRQAIICYAVGLLMREDVTSEDPYPGTPYGPTARRAKSGGKSGGLVSEAEKLLRPFRRVR
jgi:hypothetical protein